MARGLGFTAADAAAVSFGISCMWEVVASLRALRAGGTHPAHATWVHPTRPLLDADDLALLTDLVGSSRQGDYMPDLLTPPPNSLASSLDEELEILLSTDPDVVRFELRLIRARWTPQLAAFHDDPAQGLSVLAGQVRRYWSWAVAPSWPRIRRILEAEVFRRAHQLAEVGTGAMLNDLHERVTWDGERLQVAGTTCVGDRALRGAGLRLVPSVFVWPGVLTVIDSSPAQLAFPASAAATVWCQDEASSPSLQAVLGRPKARLLSALRAPSSSQAVALHVGLSPASVSEHLQALRDAGLVTSHRLGRRLVNVRTDLGSALVEAAAPTAIATGRRRTTSRAEQEQLTTDR